MIKIKIILIFIFKIYFIYLLEKADFIHKASVMHVVFRGRGPDVHVRLLLLHLGHVPLLSDLDPVDVQLPYLLRTRLFISGGDMSPLEKVLGQIIFDSYKN